jgi:hypothetical protein
VSSRGWGVFGVEQEGKRDAETLGIHIFELQWIYNASFRLDDLGFGSVLLLGLGVFLLSVGMDAWK